jgi:ferritin-like metal-binding protein YciE
MKTMNLKDLLINKIQVLYDVETSLVKALPKMQKAATDRDLKNGFADHLVETKNHVKRIENIFSLLNISPKKLKSEAIRGLIKDGEWVVGHTSPKDALDASLARAAQYVEHYEMAGYMGAISWAEDLEMGEVESLLKETLAEEKAANEKLDEAGSKIQKETLSEL